MAVRREDELDSAKQGPDAKENLEDHGQTPECREAAGYRSWPRGRSGNADRGCHLITSGEIATCHVCEVGEVSQAAHLAPPRPIWSARLARPRCCCRSQARRRRRPLPAMERERRRRARRSVAAPRSYARPV